jgi:hypothetical protein
MIAEKSSLNKALEVGREAAALSCLKAGAQHGMPMRDAIGEVARSAAWHRRRCRTRRAIFGGVKALDIRFGGEDRRRLTGQRLWMRIGPSRARG